MKLHGDWKPADGLKRDLQSATLACRQLKCGSAVSTQVKSSALKDVWGISSLREHVSLRPWHSSSRVEIACSGNNLSDSVVMVIVYNLFIILTANGFLTFTTKLSRQIFLCFLQARQVTSK